MAERYSMERGDVLMSVQLVLARESERGQATPETPPPTLRLRPSPLKTPFPIEGARRAAPGPRPLPNVGVAPSSDLMLVDPATGAPSLAALRRDIDLLGGRSAIAGARLTLCSVEVQLIRAEGPVAANARDDVMRALVELVPFALRAKDRVYRTGPNELALLFTGAGEEGAAVALARFEADALRVLKDRKLPKAAFRHRIFGQTRPASQEREERAG